MRKSSEFTFTVNATVNGAGQINFASVVSPKPTTEEAALLPSVNLSRAATRMYRLDNLAGHDNSGARWNTGTSGVHGTISQSKYRQRVANDLNKAWSNFKASVDAANAKAVAAAQAAAAPQYAPATSGQLFFSSNGS